MTNLSKFLVISGFVFLLSGCCTECPKTGMIWASPPQSIKKSVNFQEKDGGLFLDKTNSANLLYNINEMQAYQKNLETLISTMKQYYKAK